MTSRPFRLCLWRVFVLGALFAATAAMAPAAEFHFDSSPSGEVPAGFTRVTPQTAYDAQRGFGFLPPGTAPAQPGAEEKPAAPNASSPAIFAVAIGEGNYDVTMRFGDPQSATSTTIKAESRRLMIERVETAPGKFETRTFTVNVRQPAIRAGDFSGRGGSVMLKPRELGPPVVADWDERLTFEFNGAHPGVASLEIRPAANALTIFIAGDSTVTDQAQEPYAGWGQMLPRFFQPGVAVSNQAESGLALSSFESQKRLEKILSLMKAGDYFFIQFGHNDQKEKGPGAGPFTTYKARLKKFVQAARHRGALPVLVTPMERRRWEAGQPQPTLADYAEAVRQVGTEEKAPVIDLNAMSLKFYTALGPEKSTQAFAFYPAKTFPGQDQPLQDNTHHNAYGAYELARCIVEGIKTQVPDLASRLAPDTSPFDPTKPDAPETVALPASPLTGPPEKPAGS